MAALVCMRKGVSSRRLLSAAGLPQSYGSDSPPDHASHSPHSPPLPVTPVTPHALMSMAQLPVLSVEPELARLGRLPQLPPTPPPQQRLLLHDPRELSETALLLTGRPMPAVRPLPLSPPPPPLHRLAWRWAQQRETTTTSSKARRRHMPHAPSCDEPPAARIVATRK